MARKATVDKMIKAIRESDKPALTKQDIADGVGVSWQTINNHEQELEDDPRVQSGKVGKAKVYWLPVKYDPDKLDGEPQTPGPDERPDISGIVQPPTDSTEDLHQHDEEELSEGDTQTKRAPVERLAHRRIPGFGALFLALAVIFAPLGLSMVVGGSVLPGAIMLVLAGFCLVSGVGLLLVAAVALWYLERPLKELITGVNAEMEETNARV